MNWPLTIFIVVNLIIIVWSVWDHRPIHGTFSPSGMSGLGIVAIIFSLFVTAAVAEAIKSWWGWPPILIVPVLLVTLFFMLAGVEFLTQRK